MKIRIISPGKIREPFLAAAVESARQSLSQRLKTRQMSIELIEVEDSPDNWPIERALQFESQRIRTQLKAGDYLIALDLDGQWPKLDAKGSLEPAWQRWLDEAGSADLVFLIGGSNGLNSELKKQAKVCLRLSDLTFTHQMARLILLDLILRALPANAAGG